MLFELSLPLTMADDMAGWSGKQLHQWVLNLATVISNIIFKTRSLLYSDNAWNTMKTCVHAWLDVYYLHACTILAFCAGQGSPTQIPKNDQHSSSLSRKRIKRKYSQHFHTFSDKTQNPAWLVRFFKASLLVNTKLYLYIC